MSELLYVVHVDGNSDLGPYDAVYGYGPVIFRDEEEAEAKAEELSTTGYWPGSQPTYSVVPMTLEEIRRRFFIALDRGIK